MQNKNVYPTKHYIRFLTFIVFSFFTFFYRIKKKLPSEIKKLKSPYLLLSNHVGHWDPFVAGHFLPQFTHFVALDAVFRGKFTRFFLTRLGTIPKKKNIKDTKVIRVIVSVLKEMNLFNPRWARKLRCTQVEVEYKLLLNQEQIHMLSEDEIYERIKNVLIYDEVEYQRTNMNKIYSKQKAENINHALYVCPQCNAIDSFRVNKNDFVCSACNYDIHIDEYGFFERIELDFYEKEELIVMEFDKLQTINPQVNERLEIYYNFDINFKMLFLCYHICNYILYITIIAGGVIFILFVAGEIRKLNLDSPLERISAILSIYTIMVLLFEKNKIIIYLY